ncbi:MAG: rhodanese-like domain-containing protein [Chloroflexi bacterium]|nr:MAG: rhodanese-like domain-containing protein [Chloroflexota bacterium]
MNLFSRFFGNTTQNLNVNQVREWQTAAKKPLLIDVRQPEEFREGHIPGSKLIPLGELNHRLKDLPKDREIVCICRSGNRSGAAVRKLVSAGFKSYNMRGGMKAWQRAGLPLKKGLL